MQTVSRLMNGRPEQAWIDAIGSESHETMHFPVDGGRVGRGVGFVRRAALRHRRHDGVDIGAAPGTPVRAVEDAIVAYADNGVSGYGNVVLLVHPDGSTTLYAHLTAAYVFAGERLARGQVLGEVGTTGLAYGPHLHFEWRVNGRPRNPVRRFDAPLPAPHPVASPDQQLASR
jgi:murein DD-endopeptidase MepM/ murein hydrolase activator NlpD